MAEEPTRAIDRFLELLDRLRRLGPEQPPFEEIQITPSQLLLLDRIVASPGCSIREVATELGLTSPTVSVGVRRLEEVGLVERRPDARDRRAVRLFATPRGEALQQRAQAYRRQKAHRLLADLTLQEQAQLLDLLDRAISTAEEAVDREDAANS